MTSPGAADRFFETPFLPRDKFCCPLVNAALQTRCSWRNPGHCAWWGGGASDPPPPCRSANWTAAAGRRRTSSDIAL